MKALKAEVRQPESFLRDVLGDVAILIRTGKFAGNYQLNAASAASVYGNGVRFDVAQGSMAPEAAPGMDGASEAGDGFDGDDDGNVKMEDAPL